MPKLSSKQVKFETEIPTLISEMEDGEFRFTRYGPVGRLGDVAHGQELTDTYMYMDPFDQAQLDDVWAFYLQKGTGLAIPDNGRLKITAYAEPGLSRPYVRQETVSAFAYPTPGELYFDIWGKMEGSLNPQNEGGGNDLEVRTLLQTNVNTFSVILDFHSTQDAYRMRINKPGSSISTPYIPVATSGANVAYWRFRYLPGDSGIKVYWQHTNSPLDVGWLEHFQGVAIVPTDPMMFEFYFANNEPAADRDAYFYPISDWPEVAPLDILVTSDDTEMSTIGPSWEIMKAKTEADNINPTQIKNSAGIGWSADSSSLYRPYILFPLNLPEGTIISKAFLSWDTFGSGGVCEVVIQELDAEFPLSTSDWNSFTGPILIEPYLTHNVTDDDHLSNNAPFNEDGLAYLNSIVTGTAKFCVREYNHDYLDMNPLGVSSRTGLQYYDNSPGVSGMRLHLYLESDSFSEPLQVRSNRQVKMDGNVPVVAEDMKIGELRITSEGIFGRIGGVVQKKDWLNVLFYDDFEDDVLDSRWDITVNKTGGTVTEENGDLVITVNSGGSSWVQTTQNGLEAIPQVLPVAGEYYFDLWGKISNETNLGSGIADINTYVRMQFQTPGSHTIGWNLFWDDSAQLFEVRTVYSDGSFTDSNITVSTKSEAQSGHELWWRMRFLSGDSKVRMFYKHGENPHRHGWNEWMPPTASADPTGQATGIFYFLMNNYAGAQSRAVFFDQLANWVGEEITTTTTTSTSTTTSTATTSTSTTSTTTTTTTTTTPFLDFTNDTYWQDSGRPDPIQWSGTYWWPQFGNGIEGLEPIGLWSLGFRPTKMRITFRNSASVNLTAYDTMSNVLGTAAGYLPGEELALTFVGYDIGEIIFDNDSSTIEYDTIEFAGTAYAFTPDEFNDANIGDWWTFNTLRPWETGGGVGESPGGIAVEEAGLMKLQLPANVGTGQNAKVIQTIDGGFDVYIQGQVLESGGGGTDGTELFFAIYDTQTQWGLSFEYGYDQGSTNWNLYAWTRTTGGTAANNQMGTFVPDTIWLRIRYRAGDAAPTMWYSFNDGHPWIAAAVGGNDLTLVDFSDLRMELVGRQYDSGGTADVHFDFVREGHDLTTTSTTTTTTTTT